MFILEVAEKFKLKKDNLVQIMLMIAALDDLDLQAADIENAYLTAPCREKIWKELGQNLEWMKERYLLWLEI